MWFLSFQNACKACRRDVTGRRNKIYSKNLILIIEQPYSENDSSKSVCVTFVRNAEKQWIDGEDLDRTGAQYDGIIFNNMSSTIITDWNFSISVPARCSVDPGPWNGTFTLSEGSLNVIKPLTNKLFDICLGLIFIVFIVATTIMLFEGKLIRVEEENKKLESTGMPMKIHVTETTKEQTLSHYQYSSNTEIDVKGKGMMKTYFL